MRIMYTRRIFGFAFFLASSTSYQFGRRYTFSFSADRCVCLHALPLVKPLYNNRLLSLHFVIFGAGMLYCVSAYGQKADIRVVYI